jgi:ring-1,2-phenylacetyl-CoA epoxidase subunit PaaB
MGPGSDDACQRDATRWTGKIADFDKPTTSGRFAACGFGSDRTQGVAGFAINTMHKGKEGEPMAEAHYDVYEVFIQKDILTHHVHVGSVVAPSPELALQVARENFLRRDTAVNIWVVLQQNIHGTSYEDKDALANQVLDKSYREVSGYSENAQKWKRFKERAITIDDVVNDMKK